MKKQFTLFLLFLSINIWATAPAGYYNSADGKNTAALRSALQSIITNGHSVTSYSGLWTAYSTTDRNSSGKIWDIYSNCTFTYSTNQCGTYSSECDCYNREHTTPQSWFSEASPMVSDLFNVYPSDGKVNGMRSNYPYGEVGSVTYTSGNGSKLGSSNFSGYSGTVFEPINEFKGDLARTYFYMATRYASVCESWSSGAEVVYGSNLGFTPYAMNLFLKWSRQDPVSAKEIARNDAAYGVQNNRNPFIDYPGMEEYIWGNKTSSNFSITGTPVPALTSPSNSSLVDFGKVAFQQTDTVTVFIKGTNLTGDMVVALSGTNSSYFSLPVSTISVANAQAGYKLVVNYTAQVLGTHTATLTISGGGITNTTVTLNATSTDSFLALPATNVTGNGFTANWSSSANASGYLLNVYSYTGNTAAVPQTLLEEDFTAATLPTGWTSSGYIDYTLTSNIKLASGSQIGKITTPVINMSVPTTLVVRAKQYGTDAGAKLTVKVNADSITTFVTGTTNQDFTVNIPVKTSTSSVSLSALAGSGNRVYVDYVKVSTQGTILTPVSVSGYPKQVGNVLNSEVTELLGDSLYYYTVTPQGNSAIVSEPIRVRTSLLNSVLENQFNNLLCRKIIGEGIQVLNIPQGCKVSVLDLMGKQLKAFNNSSSELTFKLSQKGLYLLQIQQNETLRTFKVVY
ncbi:MAG TPA: endonuclease [Paludibacter sp.]